MIITRLFSIPNPKILLLLVSSLCFSGWTAGSALIEPEVTATGAGHETTLNAARRKMVEEDIRCRGIRDQRVLQVLATLPRHLFVPEDIRRFAYEDRPLPIGFGQTISQPYMVAWMTELLQLNGNERVLEIGTGSGYQAAVTRRIKRRSVFC
jgi:protein-L-isoaspartate(D-aspartate) O-methyltransferase